MQFRITVNEHGKIAYGAEEIARYLTQLKGKNCIFTIQEENNLTTAKECRAAYFFKLDLVCSVTGGERYEEHEAFKRHLKIESTKDFTVIDWRVFIKNFQNYIFEKLDIVV